MRADTHTRTVRSRVTVNAGSDTMASARREEEMRHTDLLRMHSATAHDWEGEKRNKKDFYDDGTMSFFW